MTNAEKAERLDEIEGILAAGHCNGFILSDDQVVNLMRQRTELAREVRYPDVIDQAARGMDEEFNLDTYNNAENR